ncbi:MAG: hypothetical protein ABI725_00595 [Chloroflexota bacterium]
MFVRSLRTLVVVAIVGAAALAATQPALAYETGHTGTVGVHSVTDTSSHPGAIGRYKYYSSDGFGWLNRFFINPPHMRAVAGKTSQTVGWRYKVERRDCGIKSCGPWMLRFTSVEMTAVTDDAHNASFSQASVSVNVPCGHDCYGSGSKYRITVKMIWHRPNGNVQGTVNNRIYWYGAQMTTGEYGVQEKVAFDRWSAN